MYCKKLENGSLLIYAITKDEQKVLDAIYAIYEARATLAVKEAYETEMMKLSNEARELEHEMVKTLAEAKENLSPENWKVFAKHVMERNAEIIAEGKAFLNLSRKIEKSRTQRRPKRKQSPPTL